MAWLLPPKSLTICFARRILPAADSRRGRKVLPGAAAAAWGSPPHRAQRGSCGTLLTAGGRPPPRIYRRCCKKPAGCAEKCSAPAPGRPAAWRHLPPGVSPAGADALCKLRSSVACPLLSPTTAASYPGARRRRAGSRAGWGGRSSVLGVPGGPPGRAATVPPHRRRSLRCPLVHLERPGLYFLPGLGGRSRGQQFVSASRCRFKRGSPRKREVSAERKHPTRRARLLSPPSAARRRPGLAGVPGPSELPRPGRGPRHRPGSPLAAGARRCALLGDGGQAPEAALRDGPAAPTGGAQPDRGGRWCYGEAVLSGAPVGSRRRIRRPGDVAAGKGTPSAGRGGRDGYAERFAALLPINYPARLLLFFYFFSPFPFLFHFPSLLLFLLCSQASSINARSCVCVGGGRMSL